MEKIEQNVAAEILGNHARLEAAARSVEGASKGVAAAQEAFTRVIDMQAAGAATKRDVLKARIALSEAQERYIDATSALVVTHAAYLQSVGTFLEYWQAINPGRREPGRTLVVE